MSPLISVIVPVYNSVAYVAECLESVFAQTLPAEQIEVVVIDDGSTDGTTQVLAEIQRAHPEIVVLHQENSGSPGGARNPGIDRATGEFVFFLDSDDKLTPDALRRLVETATSEGSDVVLGRMRAIGKRAVPASMFKRTLLDAPLLESKVFNTLGPTKLFRRELIERLALRFPVDQKVGEDQPFVAALYLNARKISVLADTDYYLVRKRDDGSNMTSIVEGSPAHLLRAVRLAHVIEKYTEEGPLRDGLMARPFGWALHVVLDGRFLSEPVESRRALVDEGRAELGRFYTEAVRAGSRPTDRIKFDLFFAGDLDTLSEYVARVEEQGAATTVWQDGAFRLLVDEAFDERITLEQRTVSPPKVLHVLEGLDVERSRVAVRGTLTSVDCTTPPDAVRLRAVKRGTGDDVREVDAAFEVTGGRSSVAVFSAVLEDLDRGVWDLFVVQRTGTHEGVWRFGRERSALLEPDAVFDPAPGLRPSEVVVAYYTKDFGNLSLDVGATMHHQVPSAKVLGVSTDEDGRCVAFVQTTRDLEADREVFGHLSDPGSRQGRHLLPATRIGPRLLQVRLPLGPESVGQNLRLTTSSHGVSQELPFTEVFWSGRSGGFDLASVDGRLHVHAEAPHELDGGRPTASVKAPRTAWQTMRRLAGRAS